MSDIRFACPFCAQHIACDRSFSGTPIDCPSCAARITVPRLLTVATERPPIPVALPAPRSTDLGMWTEEAWRDHARRHPGIYSLNDSRWGIAQLPIALAMCLPVLFVLGANRAMMWTAIIVGVFISGYVVRRSEVAPDAHPAVSAGVFVLGMMYYAMLAEVFLLGGCCWPGRSI